MVKYSLPPGFLNVNKPSGLTAHDVVNRLRKLAGIKQIGHAGTLDPMASGVLPVAIGRACRLLRFLPDDKVYLASILFGRKTDTDDIEGKIIATSCHLPASPDISTALADFVGDIEQVPPLYSAIHVEGKRLYELARQGKTPAFLPVRKVHIYSIEEIDYRRDTVSVPEAASCPSSCTDTPGTLLELRIHCASGTYIRSIARDLGDRLGSAACLAALKRESAGLFNLEASLSLEQLAESAFQGTLAECLSTPEMCLPQPVVDLPLSLCQRLTQGQCISVKSDTIREKAGRQAAFCSKTGTQKYVLALLDGKLKAVCSISMPVADKTNEFAYSEESSIVELKPEVVLSDGSSF